MTTSRANFGNKFIFVSKKTKNLTKTRHVFYTLGQWFSTFFDWQHIFQKIIFGETFHYKFSEFLSSSAKFICFLQNEIPKLFVSILKKTCSYIQMCSDTQFEKHCTRVSITQWFSTFFGLRHIFHIIFGDIFLRQNAMIFMFKWQICMIFPQNVVSKNFGDTLEKTCDTQMCRDTLFENHCDNESNRIIRSQCSEFRRIW